MPSTNVTTGQVAYQGNFTKTVMLLSGHPTSVSTVIFGGVVPFGPEWHTEYISWLLGAKVLKGSNWTRPEACGEIAIA